MSRDGYYYWRPIKLNQYDSFRMCADGFEIFQYLTVVIFTFELFICFYAMSNQFWRSFSKPSSDHENAFKNPPVVPKYNTRSRLGQENLNVRYCFWHSNEGWTLFSEQWTLEKIANDREGSRHRNYDAASKLILRIST